MRTIEQITPNTIEVMENCHDSELSRKILDSFVAEVIDEKGVAETKKSLCALASATAEFLHFVKELSKKERGDDALTLDEITDAYTELLEGYCLVLEGSPDKDNK